MGERYSKQRAAQAYGDGPFPLGQLPDNLMPYLKEALESLYADKPHTLLPSV